MKTLTLVGAALAALSLSACAGQSNVGLKLLSNLEGCERTYQGEIGGLSLTGARGLSVTIRCEPRPVAPSPGPVE